MAATQWRWEGDGMRRPYSLDDVEEELAPVYPMGPLILWAATRDESWTHWRRAWILKGKKFKVSFDKKFITWFGKYCFMSSAPQCDVTVEFICNKHDHMIVKDDKESVRTLFTISF